MNLKNIIRKSLFGITLPQEFICVDIENFHSPLKIFLNKNKHEEEEICLGEQIFLGYKPLLFGLTADKNSTRHSYLSENFLIELDFRHQKNSVAMLKLKRIQIVERNNKIVFLFEGVYGRNNFLPFLFAKVNDLKYHLTANKKSNVYLSGNLYNQVIIAYSIPRIISLISLSDGTHCNLFPTDLNGFFGKENYIVSLRIGGNVSSQVEKIKKIVISQMPVGSCNYAYSLSKNHMHELKEESNFNFRKERSVNFNFPLPENAIRYSELELYDSFEAGIHKLYLFKIIQNELLSQNTSILAHIHRTYAEWRKRNSLPNDFFLR